MKYEDLMEYSKESLVSTILEYQDKLIQLKKEFVIIENCNDQNYERYKELERQIEKSYKFAYEILEDKGETFGY